MTEARSMPPDLQSATAPSLREWLGVLVLSTGILRRHGSSLREEDRAAQREIMHEAGARLAEELAKDR